jgi:hypothetical protein
MTMSKSIDTPVTESDTPGWAMRHQPEIIPDPLPPYLMRLSDGRVVPRCEPYLTQTMVDEDAP